jgi:hypothetical protein
MRGVFDEREAERERRKRGRETRDRDDGREEERDREVTLGSFTLLAILCVLVVLCGISFGLGYVVGRREPAVTSSVLEPTPIAGQADIAKSKPSGGSGSGGGAASEAQSVGDGTGEGQLGAGQEQGRDAASTGAEATAAASSKGTEQGSQNGAGTSQVRPAMPAVADGSRPQQAGAKAPQQTQANTIEPALGRVTTKVQSTPPIELMVQVATLAHQEDADVLVEALRRRGYAVAAHRDADGMVHVRVGPFASRDVANQWRQKLLNDGYNAVVQGQ